MDAADVVVYGAEPQYEEYDDGTANDDGTAGNRLLIARALKLVKKLTGVRRARAASNDKLSPRPSLARMPLTLYSSSTRSSFT